MSPSLRVAHACPFGEASAGLPAEICSSRAARAEIRGVEVFALDLAYVDVLHAMTFSCGDADEIVERGASRASRQDGNAHQDNQL